MARIIINGKVTTIFKGNSPSDFEEALWTENAFGDILFDALTFFGNHQINSTQDVCQNILPKEGRSVKYKKYGFTDNGAVVLFSNTELNEERIKLDLKEAELLRLKYLAPSFFLTGIIDIEKQLAADNGKFNYKDAQKLFGNEEFSFENIKSLNQLLVCILYFYAYNDLKLVKCQHCGKWFATTTFKEKYCKRASPVAGYTHLKCEQAVRNIKQQCGRMKNNIETAANNAFNQKNQTESYNQFIPVFNNQCNAYSSTSASELQKYLDFLKKTKEEKSWLNFFSKNKESENK